MIEDVCQSGPAASAGFSPEAEILKPTPFKSLTFMRVNGLSRLSFERCCHGLVIFSESARFEVFCDGGGVMVWGMQMPDSFGKYFISGTFEFADDPTGAESWSERLEMYYRVGMPEKEKLRFQRQGEKYGAMTYKSFVLYKFIDEHGVEPDPHTPPLTAIEEAEAPKWFSAEKSHRVLGDIVELVDRIKIASGKMRDIIERFEPGVHQFFPIEIRLPNGSVFPEPYYTMAVGNWRDSVIAKPEMLDPAFRQLEKISPRSYLTQLSSFRKLRFRRGDIQDAHLWCERFFGEKLLCFSDALMQAFTEAGLDLPNARHLAEEGAASAPTVM